MISNEQVNQIKQQIFSQIETNLPDDQKQAAKEKIASMSTDEIEEFLKQNQQAQQGQNQGQSQSQGQQCVFCSIVKGDMPSYKIQENKDNIAVLEINPISKGHVIIIPKKHVSSAKDFPKSIQTLAKDVEKTLKSKLKPKKILIKSSNLFGHEILNVIPVYKDETLESQRSQANKDGLEKLLKQLYKEEKKKKEVIKKSKPKKIKKHEKQWLPNRIP